jgi:adenylosuccinate synthase
LSQGVLQRKAYIIVDLGYGDAGKGSQIDYLTRAKQAHTIIRFNGGAQAGHNVITADGRHHTFSQFGSGMFVPGVRLYLSRYMLVEPYAMFNEEEHLHALGVNVLPRTFLDSRAPVITPYHQAANRLKELARGEQRHGSCGVGIGETVSDYLTHGARTLLAGDLPHPEIVKKKLRFIRDERYAAVETLYRSVRENSLAQDALGVFSDTEIIEIAAENYVYLAEQLTLVDDTFMQSLVKQPGVILFEGAQGILLDETYGFAPYNTWSNTTTANAMELLNQSDYAGAITRLGVLRTYFTRHGAGPFVTEDTALSESLPEPHNVTSPWQQTFRVGHFDLVAARYARDVTGDLDGLCINHIDRIAALSEYSVCEAYHFTGDSSILDGYFQHSGKTITSIPVKPSPKLSHQEKLTQVLFQCEPQYRVLNQREDGVIDNELCLGIIEQELGLPLAIVSYGPSAKEKQIRLAL